MRMSNLECGRNRKHYALMHFACIESATVPLPLLFKSSFPYKILGTPAIYTFEISTFRGCFSQVQYIFWSVHFFNVSPRGTFTS